MATPGAQCAGRPRRHCARRARGSPCRQPPARPACGAARPWRVEALHDLGQRQRPVGGDREFEQGEGAQRRRVGALAGGVAFGRGRGRGRCGAQGVRAVAGADALAAGLVPPVRTWCGQPWRFSIQPPFRKTRRIDCTSAPAAAAGLRSGGPPGGAALSFRRRARQRRGAGRKAPIRPIARRHWAASKAWMLPEVSASRAGRPASGCPWRALEGAAAVAPHLGRHQRLQHRCSSDLARRSSALAAAERDVALAAWIGADPCFAGAHPQWAVVVTVGVGGFAGLHEHGFGAAEIADGLRWRRNRAADTHGWEGREGKRPIVACAAGLPGRRGQARQPWRLVERASRLLLGARDRPQGEHAQGHHVPRRRQPRAGELDQPSRGTARSRRRSTRRCRRRSTVRWRARRAERPP